MESIRSFPSTGFGLPRVLGGSAPASAVSGPARCYCTFGLQDSPSRLKRPSSSEAPAASSPPPPLRLLPGGANQFPGGNFTRSGPAPYTAHQHALANCSKRVSPCLRDACVTHLLPNVPSIFRIVRSAHCTAAAPIASALGLNRLSEQKETSCAAQ